jgi:hypothetical protein
VGECRETPRLRSSVTAGTPTREFHISFLMTSLRVNNASMWELPVYCPTGHGEVIPQWSPYNRPLCAAVSEQGVVSGIDVRHLRLHVKVIFAPPGSRLAGVIQGRRHGAGSEGICDRAVSRVFRTLVFSLSGRLLFLSLLCSGHGGHQSKGFMRWPRLRPVGSSADSASCPTWLRRHVVAWLRPA